MDEIFIKYDTDENGIISFDEFIDACYNLIIHSTEEKDSDQEDGKVDFAKDFSDSAMKTAKELDEEEEEIPEDIADLSPDQQQATIKRRAFSMLALGTFLVLLFSGMIFFQ